MCVGLTVGMAHLRLLIRSTERYELKAALISYLASTRNTSSQAFLALRNQQITVNSCLLFLFSWHSFSYLGLLVWYSLSKFVDVYVHCHSKAWVSKIFKNILYSSKCQ